ncbi:MAG: DoxX family membrane protein [Crocinitomicaceae bacterium]
MKKWLPYIFAALLLIGAIAHVVVPEAYLPLIPDFIPSLIANIVAAAAEAVIGVLLLLPKYRAYGGLAFSLLMIAFMPLHIWDLLRDDPMITPYAAAIVRVVIQCFLIYAGWRIYKVNPKNGDALVE